MTNLPRQNHGNVASSDLQPELPVFSPLTRPASIFVNGASLPHLTSHLETSLLFDI